jgi:hypothetical protein
LPAKIQEKEGEILAVSGALFQSLLRCLPIVTPQVAVLRSVADVSLHPAENFLRRRELPRYGQIDFALVSEGSDGRGNPGQSDKESGGKGEKRPEDDA